MRVLGKLVAELDSSDLQRLIEDGVPESRILDYKEMLPGGTDSQKKKFLRDVSALANTAGGSIIFGITEERDESGKSTGIPAALTGLPDVENFDEEGRRFEQMLRDGLQPPLTGVEIHFVQTGQNHCMIVGVPKSLLGPHAVWFKADGRFYRRAGRGVYQVEVSELRRLFLELETWQREIDSFRQGRVRAIREEKIAPRLANPDGIWLHVLPLGRLDQRVGISAFKAEMVPPAGGARYWGRHLVEGFLIPDEHSARSYTLFFHNGGTEGYLALERLLVDSVQLASNIVEEELMEYARGFFNWIQAIGLTPPYALLLSIAGAKDKGLATGGFPRGVPKGFDRDEVFLPPVVVNTAEPKVEAEMRPVLDMMWQASGYEASPNYDEEGNWSIR